MIPTSYEQLLQSAGNQPLLQASLEPLLRNLEVLSVPFPGQVPSYFLLDYTTRQYRHLDPNCERVTGYPVQFIIEQGTMFAYDFIHPDDRAIIYGTLVPRFLHFLTGLPEAERNQWAHSYNFRLRTPNGKGWQTLLSRTLFPLMNGHIPLAVLGYFVDISAFKDDLRIIHTIEPANPVSTLNAALGKRHIHYPAQSDPPLTPREVETLRLIAEGLSSKEIADRLSISLYTVHNHRRNMLEKAGAANASELIAFARRQGLL